jgi:predicted Zn-dependent peptidase
VYSFGAGLAAFRAASYVVIGGPSAPETALPALRTELAAVAAAVSQGVPDADLARARASLVAQWRTGVATSGGLADLAAAAIAHGEPLESVAGYPARVAAVTGDDVRRVAQRYLRPDALRVVVVGDKRLQGDLEKLGLGAVDLGDVWAEFVR